MNPNRLRVIVTRFRARFLATFPALTDQDLHTILTGPSEALLERLQARYGYSRAEAKAAWNDFVLTHVDGRDLDGAHAPCPGSGHTTVTHLAPFLRAGGALEPSLWRLMCQGWGRPAGPTDEPGFPASRAVLNQ